MEMKNNQGFLQTSHEYFLSKIPFGLKRKQKTYI